MKRRDIYLIAAALVLALALWGVSRLVLSARPRDVVRITVDGAPYQTAPLNEAREITVLQADGRVNVVKIEAGSVRMISASCPDQRCIQQGALTPGRAAAIVCLPNRVVVELISEDE